MASVLQVQRKLSHTVKVPMSTARGFFSRLVFFFLNSFKEWAEKKATEELCFPHDVFQPEKFKVHPLS